MWLNDNDHGFHDKLFNNKNLHWLSNDRTDVWEQGQIPNYWKEGVDICELNLWLLRLNTNVQYLWGKVRGNMPPPAPFWIQPRREFTTELTIPLMIIANITLILATLPCVHGSMKEMVHLWCKETDHFVIAFDWSSLIMWWKLWDVLQQALVFYYHLQFLYSLRPWKEIKL